MVIDESKIAELKKWYYRIDWQEFSLPGSPPEINQMIDALEALWRVARAAQAARTSGYGNVLALNATLDTLPQASVNTNQGEITP